MYDGTRAIAFTGEQLVRRLAAIVPPPRAHVVRNFGAFAPASTLRPKLTGLDSTRRRRRCPEHRDQDRLPLSPVPDLEVEDAAPSPYPERARRLEWSSLLARVFSADVLCCPCGGTRKVQAFIPEGRMAREIRDQLGIDATAPPHAPARAPPSQEWLDPPDLPHSHDAA
jgi:hypothetical protein